jgi:hypothetical protein
MVVEVHAAGPGDESWRSTRFTAKINNQESFVYGHTETVDMDTICWQQGDSIEHSWVKYGADEDVSLVVSKADGTDITSATVYPKNAGFTQRIANGSLYLTIYPNTTLYVEINGDRKHTLSIIGQRPKPQLPTQYTDWTTRELTVTNINTTSHVLTVANHGIPSGGFARVAINSTGDMPTTSQGLLEANHEAVAVHVSSSQVSLVDRESTAVQFSSAGTGTITMSLMDKLDGGALYFPAGVHHIGRLFRVETNTTLYFDEGAVVIGSVDLRRWSGANLISGAVGMTQGVSLEGPGILSGTYIRRADVDLSAGQYQSLVPYVALDGNVFGPDDIRTPSTNRVYGVTIFKPAFYCNRQGIGDFNQCSFISPWTYNSDGFNPVSRSTGQLGYVRDCYALTGDDSLKAEHKKGGPLYISRCFLVCNANGAIHGTYWPSSYATSDEYTTVIDDVDILYLRGKDDGQEQIPAGTVLKTLGAHSIIKCYSDGYDGSGGNDDESLQGMRHVLIKNIRIWDTACEGRPITLGNLTYPFAGAQSQQRNQHGNGGFFVFDNIYVEGTPTNKSGLYDHDENNTVSNVTIRNMEVGGVRVTTANKDTFWDIDSNVYNVTFDSPRVTDPYAGGQ